MASITKTVDSKGKTRWRIQFINKERERLSIRLGTMAGRQVETIKLYVERLNDAIISNSSMGPDTATWLAGVGDDLYAKLVAVRLVTPRVIATKPIMLLGAFLDAYIKGRTDVATRTTLNLEIVARRMKEHSGLHERWTASTSRTPTHS